MSRPIRILIDGYNLLFGCGLQERQIDSGGLARARQRLVREIRQHVRSEELLAMICVVWDAREGWGRDQVSEPGGPQILFATEYPDADSMIEQMIAESSAPQKLTVVSSDHRIRTAAERRRCHSVDSETWYDDLIRGQVAASNDNSCPGCEKVAPSVTLLDEDEIQRWEQDVAQIERAADEPDVSGSAPPPKEFNPLEKDEIEIEFDLEDFDFDDDWDDDLFGLGGSR